MNREIKFRAWDKQKRQLIEHSRLFRLDTSNEIPFLPLLEQFTPEYEVMQFTGLLDKNGTEIYEGDIVRLQSVDGVDYNAQIVFKDGGFCAIDGAIDNFAVSRYNLTIFDLEITVIGNIYEHYELLERDGE